MKPLDRQKLDVVNQTQSNRFGWRGQFTPEFVGRELREAGRNVPRVRGERRGGLR
jgi:hypothetical protein